MSDPILRIMQEQLKLSDDAVENMREQLFQLEQQLTQKDAIIKVLTEAVEFTRYSFVPDKVVEKCEQTLEKVKGIDGKTN